MADSTRIDELRRRLQKDPTSIAFAQLAEEFRRAGRHRDAAETCRAGLQRHPGYLSARVTLGRSLLELGELPEAQQELEEVLRAAPQNLAAVRGLAEIHRRRGELQLALDQYRAAFELAQNDPGIDQIVRELRRELGAAAGGAMPPSAVGVRPTPGVRAGPVDEAEAERVRRFTQVTELERWLAAVLDDRRRRLYRQFS